MMTVRVARRAGVCAATLLRDLYPVLLAAVSSSENFSFTACSPQLLCFDIVVRCPVEVALVGSSGKIGQIVRYKVDKDFASAARSINNPIQSTAQVFSTVGSLYTVRVSSLVLGQMLRIGSFAHGWKSVPFLDASLPLQ